MALSSCEEMVNDRFVEQAWESPLSVSSFMAMVGVMEEVKCLCPILTVQ